ncbi:MAG TPA: hypothetical protein VNO55_32690 [Polyangia bacterium]|nr:hypothetical protein [Polyangia bacterium]
MIIPVIAAVGAQIEQAWSAKDYDAGAFPEICVRALDGASLSQHLSPGDILAWALQGDLPRQADPGARFGQPPITLFRGRRFYIAALFWVDGTTSIHDHGFSGAFQVLSGSSIQTTFSFETTRNVGDQLRFGALAVTDSSLLRQGEIRPITAGPSFIHSLFHLPRPTVSLVVRSYFDVSPGIQLNYKPPGIAHNNFFVDETLDRLLQIVNLLRSSDDPTFEDRTVKLIASADLHTAFSIIRSCADLPDRSLLGRLLDGVRDKEARTLFTDWTIAAERVRFLQSRRAMVHDPELRFVLAVLLNVHRRADALALVAAHSPRLAPAQRLASWLRQLSAVTSRLQLASGSWEPNLFGLPPITPRLEEVLAAELADQRDLRTDEEAAFLSKLRALPALLPLFR